ncbi:unnamed protein product, partial [Arabidopsis halleri]
SKPLSLAVAVIPSDQISHLTNLSSAQQWISDHIQSHFPSHVSVLVSPEVNRR